MLVGAQGTGKSLLLQWLEVALDSGEIASALAEAGQDVRKPDALVDLIFGVGMGGAWTAESRPRAHRVTASAEQRRRTHSPRRERNPLQCAPQFVRELPVGG